MNPSYPKLQAFLTLAQQEWQKMTPGLERIQKACASFGNPESKFPSIHVAGTNGKGSVCVMLKTVLEEAGLKVGLFTSPHLVRVNERFRIAGHEISDAQLEELLEKIQGKVETQSLSFFETCVLLAFLFFAEQQVDVAILETGLGGRLDATNVVTPLLSIITEIGLDHTEILGSDIPSIALEKAGIIKEAVPVVCGSEKLEVKELIRKVALEKKSPFSTVEMANFSYRLNLQGDHQIHNAKIVLQALEVFQTLQPKLHFSSEILSRSFEKVKWPGRLEWWSEQPPILFDGAHNLEGMQALVNFLRKKKRKWRVLFSAASDKKVLEMLCCLQEIASVIVICEMKTSRSIQAQQVQEDCSALLQCPLEVGASAFEEFQKQKALLREGEGLLVTGSLYFIGDLKSALSDAHPTNG